MSIPASLPPSPHSPPPPGSNHGQYRNVKDGKSKGKGKEKSRSDEIHDKNNNKKNNNRTKVKGRRIMDLDGFGSPAKGGHTLKTAEKEPRDRS